MEPYQMRITVDTAAVDCFGRLKPSQILYYMQTAAEGHCRLLGLDWDTLAKRGLFWAVTRHLVRIARLPRIGETLTVETWPGQTGRVAYPRSCICLDAAGQVCWQSASLWVLMDAQTRAMVLPAKSGISLTGLVRGNELAAPGALPPVQGAHSTVRTVGYSELDRNCHMNNCRYLDWADDLLPADFHRAHPIAEFSVCYHSEAYEGEQIGLSWELAEDSLLRADGDRPDTQGRNRRVFSVKARFDITDEDTRPS